jgi:hypothetical protein
MMKKKHRVGHAKTNYPTATPRRFTDMFLKHSGYMSDKWSQFLPIYDFELGPMVARGRPLRLLEIGVQNGGSLEVWHEYMPKGSRIYGIDVDDRCRRLAFPPGIKVLIGDAGSPACLNALLGDEVFDIIIDDGSHEADDVTSAFEMLLPRLTPGGKYFMEDLHTSYWGSHGGGFRRQGTAIEYLKRLIDALHADYFGADVEESEQQWLSDLNCQIARASFYDSIAVIVKYNRRKTSPFNRVLCGKEMAVTGPEYLLDVIADEPTRFTLSGGARDTVVAAAMRELSEKRRERSWQRAEIEQRAASEAALRAEIEQRTASEGALRAEIEQRAATEATLRSEIDLGTEIMGSLGIALDEAQRKIESLTATAEAQEIEIAATRDALSRAERRLQARAAAAEALESECQTLRNRFVESEHRHRELQDELASLHSQLAAAREVGAAAIAALKAEPAAPW